MHEKENINNVDMNMLRRFPSVKLIENLLGQNFFCQKRSEKRDRITKLGIDKVS